MASPSPTGRFSIDTLPVKSINSPRSRRETHRRSCFPSQGTAIGSIATHCPPPLEGAGGGHVSGRAAGVFLPHTEKSVRLKRRRQERGESSPPPPSPSAPPPRRGFHIDTVPRGEDPLSAVNVNTLLKSSSSPPARYPGLSPQTARPLWRGREEAAVAAGRWGRSSERGFQ